MTTAQILIVDKSYIILRGLSSVIEKILLTHNIHIIYNPIEIASYLKTNNPDLILVNSDIFIDEQQTSFRDMIRKNKTKFIVLHLDNTPLLSDLKYDEIITLCDSEDQIIKKVIHCLGDINQQKVTKQTESISTREENILREIALGLSNKEIADKLFISQHTVITHRKNITRKLGIKSVSGLTIYAILNKLISMDEVD